MWRRETAMKNRTSVAEETPLTGSRSINAARQPRKMPKTRMHHNWVLWIRLECTRCMGFVVSWIFRLTRADIMHTGKIETLLRLSIPRFHSCTRALAQVFSLQNDNRMQNDCSICVSRTWNEISILFGSPVRWKASFLARSEESARLAKSSRTCWTLLSMPRRRNSRY